MEDVLYYLVAFSLFLSIILLINSAKGIRAVVFLSLFYFVLSLNMLGSYILLYSDSVLLGSIFITNFDFTRYLLGPLAYFYIRDTLLDTMKFQKNDLLHFLLPIVVLISLIPHLFSTYEHKVFMVEQILADRGFLKSYKPSILYDLIGVRGIYLLSPLQTLVYILFGLDLYVKSLLSKYNSVFQSQRKIVNTWLGIFIFFLVLVCISQLTIYEDAGGKNNMDSDLSAHIMLYLTMAGILGLLITPFVFPSILYGLPVLKHKTFLIRFKEQAKGEFMEITTKKNSTNFLLESMYLKSIEQKIDQCMELEKPYLKPDFNMNVLSTLINIPLHHLGYYFREFRQSTFTDLKNEYRVKHAIQLMENGDLSHFTLETIGIQSGFETRNTFRNAFKKQYAMTPSEYIERKRTN
jgi:AraC-like DNA-binding protein